MTKPDLSLYIGKYVARIIKNDAPDNQPWQWGIELDNHVVIYNKDRRETFVPDDVVGKRIETIILSQRDTTIVFSGGMKWSLNPTQYTIADPHYGGEVFPQWPEELEDRGITSHPDEPPSAQPDDPEKWYEHRQELLAEHDRRHADEAAEFLKED